MAKFVYRMQNILDIKYKLEEQAKQQYMEVRARLNEALEVLDHLNQRKEGYFAQYRKLVSDRLELLDIEECKNSISLMDEYIAGQKLVIRQIEIELEEAIRVMNEAMRSGKSMKSLGNMNLKNSCRS